MTQEESLYIAQMEQWLKNQSLAIKSCDEEVLSKRKQLDMLTEMIANELEEKRLKTEMLTLVEDRLNAYKANLEQEKQQ